MIKPAILHYCKYQERCHQEVRNKLYELGCYTEEVEQQITELIETGVLNEERFARAYAVGKFRMMQWGREKIRQHLKMKRISDYCIKKALSEIDGEDYVRVLNKLAERKAAEVKGDRSVQSRKAKLFRYLIQKGFERDLVMDVINGLTKR
jgi:regulatory protein